jgi:hypothetical protein
MARLDRLALVVFAGFGSAVACSGPDLETDPPPFGEGLRGEVEVRIVDHFDGRSERQYRLHTDDGKIRRLTFGRDPELTPGARVAVWGDDEGRAVRVLSWKAQGLGAPDLDVQQRPLIGAPPMATRKLAFVLIDLGGGVNITADVARQRAFGLAAGDQSMKQVIGEYSFGRQDLTGEVLGPFKATMNGCDEDAVAEQLKPMVPGFDNYVWYLGQRNSACDWAGTAGLGRPGKIFPQLWVNGTASCRVATHEFGHNLGLQHAARLRCTGAALADDPSTCRSSEYGDSTDVMGDGCNHFNGYSKAYLSWFERCNGVEAKSSGTFTLLPVETACNGTQVLLVPMPKLRRVGGTDLQNYVLELRAPIGLDSKLGPVVMVRLAAPINQMRGGRMTWILDMDPATTALDGLRQGQSFTDPAGGVSFRVEAISATSASVKVEIAGGSGAPACLDGTPFTAPGPDTCGNASEGPVVVAPPDAGAAPADAGATGAGGRDAVPGRNDAAAPDAGGGTGGAGGAGGAPPKDPDPGPAMPPPGSNSFSSASSGCACGLGGTTTAPAGLPLALLLGGLGMRRLRRRS